MANLGVRLSNAKRNTLVFPIATTVPRQTGHFLKGNKQDLTVASGYLLPAFVKPTRNLVTVLFRGQGRSSAGCQQKSLLCSRL